TKSSASKRCCGVEMDQAGNAARAAATAPSTSAASPAAYWSITSETSDGLISGLVCLPAVHWPAMRLARIGFLLGYHGNSGGVESSEGILRFRLAGCCRSSFSANLSDAADRPG